MASIRYGENQGKWRCLSHILHLALVFGGRLDLPLVLLTEQPAGKHPRSVEPSPDQTISSLGRVLESWLEH
jgi:hypothetical protein